MAVINSTILGVRRPARQRLRDEPSRREQPHNLLQAMIGAADQPDSGLEDRHVAGNVLTMLLAGAEQPFSAAARRSAMPSGSGPRRCPGRCLALREMKVAMAMLLSSFDIDAVHTSDGVLAEERRAFTTNPVGLRMRRCETVAVSAETKKGREPSGSRPLATIGRQITSAPPPCR